MVLDCVFDDATATYWVLDGLAWRDMSLYDSTAEFRFYWLHTKVSGCVKEALMHVTPSQSPHNKM